MSSPWWVELSTPQLQRKLLYFKRQLTQTYLSVGYRKNASSLVADMEEDLKKREQLRFSQVIQSYGEMV